MNDLDRFGFGIHDAIFSRGETKLFLRGLDELNVNRTKAGVRHLLRFHYRPRLDHIEQGCSC